MSESTKNISVIMPVWNAASFLGKAIESVLIQPNVLELILIEDGSTDESLRVCQSFLSKYENIKLLRHSQGSNLGPGLSRNLGIDHAKGEYLAFLDADDFYLKDRFSISLPILQENLNLDGVYEVVGVEYYSLDSKKKHVDRMRALKKNILSPEIPLDYTGMERNISSESLFFHLLKTDAGWIHLNGLLLRGSSLESFGGFNEKYFGEDSEFIFRLSCERSLRGTGSLHPVAVRGVHDANRITAPPKNIAKINVGWNYWLKYSIQRNVDLSIVAFIILRLSDTKYRSLKVVKVGFLWASVLPSVLLKKFRFS